VQDVVIEKPYKFIPPHYGRGWPTVLRKFLPFYLDRFYGIESAECRNTETVRRSIQAGHGVILAGNHSRICDPMVLGMLMPYLGTPLFAMGSWHLFMQSRFQCFMARRCGAFSVYREGMDRQAINTAIDILDRALRPLVIFPEGVVTRTNDLVTELLEGVALIARSAAKKRAKTDRPGKVVVHPVALKYYFPGDLAASVDPVLTQIEHRLSWRPQRELPLASRVRKLGEALLCLKEFEYLGGPQQGTWYERLQRLIEHILCPLEDEWCKGKRDEHVVARVKKLRSYILPDMISGRVDAEERQRRWRQLADMYLAQQLAWYPRDYVESRPTQERLLETVERIEEDLTDVAKIHRPLRVVIECGEAIEVSPERDRSGSVDPLLVTVRQQLQAMLDRLAEASTPLPESALPRRESASPRSR
jgi:1-acyl-sn-glycerol-3-phosphate acyltransferase